MQGLCSLMIGHYCCLTYTETDDADPSRPMSYNVSATNVQVDLCKGRQVAMQII